MQKIPLTKGKYALVDAADAPRVLAAGRWCAHWNGKKWYAVTNRKRPLKGTLRLHRFLMGEPKGKEVDHQDGDGLNNQRDNLRVCTHQENLSNQKRRSDNTSGFKGVRWYKRTNRWKARITAKGKEIYLGYFKVPQEAARVYDEAAKKYHGDFARLNFN